LPGKDTREGYGAEVNVIARPHLHEELMPNTFRGLVLIDLVDQFSFPLVKFLDSKEGMALLERFKESLNAPEVKKQIEQHLEKANEVLARVSSTPPPDASEVRMLLCQAVSSFRAVETLVPRIEGLPDCYVRSLRDARRGLEEAIEMLGPDSDAVSMEDETQPIRLVLTPASPAFNEYASPRMDMATTTANSVLGMLDQVVSTTELLAEQLSSAFLESPASIPDVSVTPSRRSKLPFPTTQAFQVFSGQQLGHIALVARALKNDVNNKNHTLMLDMQKLLSEEFNAAYNCLNAQPHLWDHCTPELAAAVRRKDTVQLANLRNCFEAALVPRPHNGQEHTIGLAWAILVESALLNERLKQDIRDLAAAKNAYTLNVDTLDWMQFCGPNPSPEARMLFNEYVRVRWPIHVLTIDPITQDQNVADQFSLRREMQLALSLAFATGRIGAQNFLQTARRLELDMETIALNRTVVGYSHGGDTFGWRFYPRVQSPPNVGHFTAFTRDMMFGRTRDYDLRKRRIEPGIRECTAIVIMPSFVPYVVFDVRTNWFRLDNPMKRKLDVKDGVELSRDITEMRQLALACAEDAHLYRPDEVYRLQRSVEQLERRLPLQSLFAQMPFENSLGGFEFFNSGVPDLAPELRGFYGEPGIRVGGAGTTKTSIFLVGNHFSVHETKVIVGNVALGGDDVELISRQVMRVKVPDTALARDGFVDVHVATPYGVSNHIDVPAVSPAPAAAAVEEAIKKAVAAKHPVTFKWAKETLKGCIQFGPDQLLQQVCIEGGPTLSRVATAPPKLLPRFFDFAAYVFVRPKGGDFAQLMYDNGQPVVIGPLPDLDFDGTKYVFAGAPCERGLAIEMLRSLKTALHPSMNIDAIQIRGFVRGRSDTREGLPVGLDGLPIVPIENYLTIEVTACTDCCPPVVAPCPPVVIPSPEVIPSPMRGKAGEDPPSPDDPDATPGAAAGGDPAPSAQPVPMPAPAPADMPEEKATSENDGTSYRLPAPGLQPQWSPIPSRIAAPAPAPSRLVPPPRLR
ncbi:MAG: hypothetical protein ACF8TS_22415, partial [Maioricimonas sp. JB049]